MRIVEKSINEIVPYENNPRINHNAVEYVANSIREFGFKQPIVVDAQGVIIAGHTRYKAAQMLALEQVPCVVASELSPEQVRAYRLADNKTAELAEWDMEKLCSELSEIANFDMTSIGFSEDELMSITQEVDLDSLVEEFFMDAPEKAKSEKRCPHCGELL